METVLSCADSANTVYQQGGASVHVAVHICTHNQAGEAGEICCFSGGEGEAIGACSDEVVTTACHALSNTWIWL